MLVSLSFAKILSAREINRLTNFPKAVQRSEAGFNPSPTHDAFLAGRAPRLGSTTTGATKPEIRGQAGHEAGSP